MSLVDTAARERFDSFGVGESPRLLVT